MENKISTGKILLTISMILLLVVAVIGLGLFGTSVNATSQMGEIVAKADAVHENHAICVGPDDCIKEDCTHTEITTWEPFDVDSLTFSNYSTNLSGSYYLTEDVAFPEDSGFTVQSGAELNLCLNGHKLSFTDVDITIKVLGTLNICDCCTESVTHYGSVNEDGYWEPSATSGADDLKGGYLTFEQTTFFGITNPRFIKLEGTNATFNFYSGNIAGIYTYNTNGYRLIDDASATLGRTSVYQGNIIGNNVTEYLIYNKGGSLKVFGGVISKNTTEDYMVYVQGGNGYFANEISENYTQGDYLLAANTAPLTLDGASVINNTTDYESKYVLYGTSSTFTIKDSIISGNKSEGGDSHIIFCTSS